MLGNSLLKALLAVSHVQQAHTSLKLSSTLVYSAQMEENTQKILALERLKTVSVCFFYFIDMCIGLLKYALLTRKALILSLPQPHKKNTTS